MTRPLVALDFDGVLNPLVFDAPAGFAEHRLAIPADKIPHSPFLRRDPDGGIEVTVLINPDHGRWITTLREHADLAWSTTWEHLANDYIAPLLGIDPLPVAVDSDVLGPKFTEDSASWKARSLIERYGEERPLAWLDDHSASWVAPTPPTDTERAELLEAGVPIPDYGDEPWWRAGPTLVIAPNSKIGVSAEQMAAIDAFVGEH